MTSASFQTKILRRRTTPEEYPVYRAGLEWDLLDPIVIEKREDLKSELRWRDRLNPFNHQVTNLMTFCRRLPVTLLADDVGLGKTISAGLIVSELMSRSRVSKVLVVCPKLLGKQWQEELTTKFDIPSQVAIGQDLIDAEPGELGAVITTYASARLHLEKIPQRRFEMLILDEAHKLRNLYGVEKAPQVAVRFRKALEERRFRYVLMLTATPIHNRLWDIYSLVDLLTVARGHRNPFGTEGMFARKFIADKRDEARHLKASGKEEFRSIVYGYMSRVRRGDAKLYFPERIVQMHKVEPTDAELQLIRTIAGPIQKLNRLAQISILLALTSSPEALMAQLNNMARNGTIPPELAEAVRGIVSGMSTSAKLKGLGVLVEKLKAENPERWRLVVFTGRIETQTTIQSFLETRGLKVGIINGSSSARNQETLTRFRKNPPDLHVIVSTEAGSEGVNLQVANVLVNYDLPWNPMIVEQRIGRVQRLASEHKNVSIFNIMLRGTFEEYIVGRLMEKLQMASHAIGDIEALLEASGVEDDGDVGFDEKIRQLVVAALAGKDVEEATRREVQSIEEAKKTLETEEANINAMLGSMDGVEYVGPRAPSLPKTIRSMTAREFSLAAFASLKAKVTRRPSGLFLVEDDSGREFIRFDDRVNEGVRGTLYAPETPAFARLVDRIVATGIHDVRDLDQDPAQRSREIVNRWVRSFGGGPKDVQIRNARRSFHGKALVRVRATVAHDSYDRLVEVSCSPVDHYSATEQSNLDPLPHLIEDPAKIGINVAKLEDAARLDEAISEFSRFYLERREQEIRAAGEDERKRKKLEDDFTPRLEMTLVALDGTAYREVEVTARYTLDGENEYQNRLVVSPSADVFVEVPEMSTCTKSGKTVPLACLKKCQISGAPVLQHLLVHSDISGRVALPEFSLLCGLTGKRCLKDETEISAVSGRLVASAFLKTSAMSGKRAEPEHVGQCQFTKTEVLNTELAVSEVSGKRYRVDEQTQSSVSGKTGHKQEFLICYETHLPIASDESERCESTGNYVRKGVLESCEITGKRVLPSELSRCSVSGKRVLRTILVTSSLSGAAMLEKLAVRSIGGKYCAPVEAKTCLWSGKEFHPDDILVCELTGLTIHSVFATSRNRPRLQPLEDLLNGIKHTSDEQRIWDTASSKVSGILKKDRCRVESAILSPSRLRLAVCAEVRTWLGLRAQHVGFVYAIDDQSVLGRVIPGQRKSDGWVVI